MSDYEFDNEEPEENETLGHDEASWFGVSNSTGVKFSMITFIERARETAAGGEDLKAQKSQ